MIDQPTELVKSPSPRPANGGADGVRGVFQRVAARLSPSPDLGSTRALIALTVILGFTMVALQLARAPAHPGLGDTDDAMRLVLVRDLIAGRGWYDQLVTRLDPPHGVYLHWSRLLDGGIAGMIDLFRLWMTPAAAEAAARTVWPLLWMFPGIAAILVIARNLGGRAAVFLTAPLIILEIQLFRQFTPGRIDHHDIQIVMTVLALACATARQDRSRWAILGGVCAALGLAIGLEALPLQALVGASYGLALLRDPKQARATAAYGLALTVASAAFFAIQTPPWRWSLSFCDAMSLNLVVGLGVAGLGLALSAAVAARLPALGRAAVLGLVAVAAGVSYLALDPQCIHGPFAAMDPVVRPYWFDRVQEVQPLVKMVALERQAAFIALAMLVMALIAGGYLLAREIRAPRNSTLLLCALLVMASATAWNAWRMQDYVFWIGIPALGAAASFIAARGLGDAMVPSFAAVIVLAPSTLGQAADAFARANKPLVRTHVVDAGPRCFAPRAYARLAALPPGLVMSSQDLSPYMLALTPQSVISAPYHRMSKQIRAVHEVLNSPPALAEARARALGPTYFVDCPPYPLIVPPTSFAGRLRAGEVPKWLEPLSGAKEALKIYRVRPPVAAAD